MKDELLSLIAKKCFQYSPTPKFKLVSGKMSNYYVNCKPVILSPRGMYLIGHLTFDAVKDANVVAVGGLTFGADPISVAAAFVSELKKQPLQAFSVRKEQKKHGTSQWIEGDLASGDRVAILEDVVTTGGSTIRAIERARSEGLDVVKIVVAVDRQEGGIENIKEHVPDVTSLITRDELMREAGLT